MKLYELTSNFNQLQQMIEDGVDPEVINDTLQSISEAIKDKVQGAALLIRNIEAQVEVIKGEKIAWLNVVSLLRTAVKILRTIYIIRWLL